MIDTMAKDPIDECRDVERITYKKTGKKAK
jgi:hypothetical protein